MGIRRLAVAAALTFSLATIVIAGKKENAEFDKVWNAPKSTCLQKNEAVAGVLSTNVDTDTVVKMLQIMESDVWQYRGQALMAIRDCADAKVLAELEKFLFDGKKSSKQAAAAEHTLWALYNNKNWVSAEKWTKAGDIVRGKDFPEKVKARMIRELGAFRGDHKQGVANVKLLAPLLSETMKDKKFSRQLRFLLVDALESLTGEEFGEETEKWDFFANGLAADAQLKPRTATKFKDSVGDVDLEGHSFVRKAAPKGGSMELLILPDLYKSPLYWYPYIFELNKTFTCTFVDLPDCSRMKDLKWMKNQDGSDNRTAYYYPLEQLVEAFEKRRETSKKAKVGLVAHGVSGWIALEYLRLHPESVAFAIIIETWSGGNSRNQARIALEGSKDPDWKYHGIDLVYDPSGRTGSLSLNDEQKFHSSTGSFKRRWADPKALEPLFYTDEAFRVQPKTDTRILVPDYEFSREIKGKRIDVPTLFVHGGKDPMYVKDDESVYRKGFNKMTWAVYENSADTPWAEEPVRFFEEFEKLLADHKILEKLKEEEEKQGK
ncbi:MAG: alpha/beta hydrolase [Planctomycetes bacterium]|nr:alpha/beta hydrolase [Planctomycetota bacterium]